MTVPSKKVLISIAVVAFLVFAVALRQYLTLPSQSPAAVLALVIWAVGLLVSFEATVLIRQAKRPFHLGVYSFALIFAGLVILLHWLRG